MNIFYCIQSCCSKSSEIMANKTLSWEVEFCIAKVFIMCGFRECTHVPECLIVLLLFYYFVSIKWL